MKQSKYTGQWITIREDNLPPDNLICQWKYKEKCMDYEIGNLVAYRDPKNRFVGWFIYIDAVEMSFADVCLS